MEFWALAAKASVYLLNHSLHSGLDNTTPHEMWFGKKPHVGHIRVWVCRAYAAVPKERRKKFESRWRECILVGFYDTENLYQLWDVEAKEVVKRRDVIFHEHILGHPVISRSPTSTSPMNSTVDIVGIEMSVIPEIQDDLEDLYAVIEQMDCPEWTDIPITHLPLPEEFNRPQPRTYSQAVTGKDAEHWQVAIQSEHASLKKNGVFQWVVKPKNVQILPCRWLFAIKRNMDGTVRYKARLVAGGHRQCYGIDFKETFAPVAKFVSLRILLSIVASENLDGEQVDIVTAFLHGDLDELVYMKVPEALSLAPGDSYLDSDDGSHTVLLGDSLTEVSFVWKLKKSLYGLRQSPRCFYNKLDDVLKKADKGYARVPADYGVWVLPSEVVLLVHVDDMQVFGTKKGIDCLITVLESSFAVKRLGPTGTELFLGLNIQRDRPNRKIYISQSHYAKQILSRFEMDSCSPVMTPMDTKIDWSLRTDDIPLSDENKTQYQAAVGSLIYLMLGSRPDLAFSVNKLAQYCASPCERHWLGIKRIFWFIKGTVNTKLVLGVNHQPEVPRNVICGYFDSAYMDNSVDRHSTMGYAFYYAGSLVSWSSRKQRTLALSTTEAKYLAGTEATKEAIWIQQFLLAIGAKKDELYPAALYGDNQGANALAKNPEYHSCTKHIHGRQRFITEMVEQKIITVAYIPTCDMVADTLTKPLPRDSYWRTMRLLGLQSEYCETAGVMSLSNTVPSQNNPFICIVCGVCFKSRNKLFGHLRRFNHEC